MLFTSIASGSSGNCTFIGTANTHILIDAGVSCKKILQAVTDLGTDACALNGILITHEHIDHVRGLCTLSKKYQLPIYGTVGTLEGIRQMDKNKEIHEDLYRVIVPDEWFTIGDMHIFPFRNMHDSADPVGYRVESGRCAVAVVTDLGNYSQYTVKNLLGLDAIVLEANHDIHMLQVGPYPYSLKRRIMSDYGHLSNERCGQLLCEIMNRKLRYVYLGHLSKENNIPDLAYATVMNELSSGISAKLYEQLHMMVANRDTLSEVSEISEL